MTVTILSVRISAAFISAWLDQLSGPLMWFLSHTDTEANFTVKWRQGPVAMMDHCPIDWSQRVYILVKLRHIQRYSRKEVGGKIQLRLSRISNTIDPLFRLLLTHSRTHLLFKWEKARRRHGIDCAPVAFKMRRRRMTSAIFDFHMRWRTSARLSSTQLPHAMYS